MDFSLLIVRKLFCGGTNVWYNGPYRGNMRIAWIKKSGISRWWANTRRRADAIAAARIRGPAPLGRCSIRRASRACASTKFLTRYDSVSLGVVLASMESAPRHRFERFRDGVVHTGSPAPAPQALKEVGRSRVRVAPVVHAPGQAGATYQPREGARLLVRRGAAAGRMRSVAPLTRVVSFFTD